MKSLGLVAAMFAAWPVSALAAVEVAPSAVNPLAPGQKIAGYKSLRFEQPYIIQRLTERTYWLAVETSNLTFHVGDEGVLVIDPLSGRRAAIALQAIASVTDLPVTALVYSHSHLDHIGEAQVFAAAAKKNGVRLRIIASQSTLDEIERHGKPVPPPTEVLPIPEGEFVFEDLTVRMFTGGKRHSIDSSITHLVQEKVVHAPDFFVPGSIPFENFDFSLDMKGFEDDLEHLIGLDWNFFNDGHGNIGSREDALFMREYIAQLRAACLAALQEHPFEDFIDPAKHRYIYSMEWVAKLAEAAKRKMDPKFTSLEEFDLLFKNHVMFMLVNTSLHQSAMVVPQAELDQKSAFGSLGVAQEAEPPGGSAASVAPAAAEVVEKMLAGVGGREAIAKLRSFSFEAKGTRYRTGDGVEPGKGLFKVSSYDLQAFHDLQGERMRLDYRNRIFSGFINEVSELLLPDAGYVMGKDDAFLPPGAWAMESARRSSTARTQFLLLPHLLLKRILENPSLVQGVADAELAHQLRTEDEVFPMTVNLDVMTGARELFSDADWLARWAAYDLAGVRHHRLEVEDEVYPIVLYVHPETGHISKLETKEHEWVRGDLSVEVLYEGWREFSGVAFPARIRMVVAGFPAIEASLAGVQVNAPPDESLFAAPEGVSYRHNPRSAQRGLRLSQWMQSWIQVGFAKDIHWPEVSAREIAEGVHFITVTSDSVNSLVVEQEERVVVIEAGPQDYRSEAIIEWVGRQFPDKPISHLVQSHHHVDHAGGIRPYAAVGAEIVVHERAESYYSDLFARPASVILPDKFDRQSQPAKLSAVAAGGKLRIEDPRNPVAVYPAQTIHCQDMLIVHLERGNMVFNGDLRSPRPGSGAGAEPEELQDGDDFNMYFYQYGLDLARTVEAYNLQPQTIIGAHGFSEPYEALTAYISPYRKRVNAE